MQRRQEGYGHNCPIQATLTTPSASTGGVFVWLLTCSGHIDRPHFRALKIGGRMPLLSSD